MADKEHLSFLTRGALIWNAWLREENYPTPDLKGADLKGAHLQGVNLEGANLRGADLRAANVRNADLTLADLRAADLRGASLGSANLRRAILSNARLEEANLGSAILDETVISSIDLSKTKGLSTCRHGGPCAIDIRTFTISKNVPFAFWRGCGLPDALIEYMPSLTRQAIQFYSCFISYSSQDQAFASRIHADLQNKGVRCWFATHDMRTGDRIRDAIDAQIRIHEKLLLILSESSVSSNWVENEVEAAIEKEQDRKTALFPVRIDDAVEESDVAWARSIKRTRHITDFSGWKNHDAYEKAFQRLLRDLKVES